MVYIHRYASPLGGITLTGDGEALTGLWFDGQKYHAGGPEAGCAEAALPVFELADRWLDLYFSGRAPDFTPPLSVKGTEFRRAVWAVLLSVPFGRTTTYGEIASRIARQRGVDRMSAQAVGGAVARNPVSLIIPCHRVIGADGGLTGYAGGLDKKARLLELERGIPWPARRD